MMCLCSYMDTVGHITGFFTEDDCWSYGNLVDVDVPEDILNRWYNESGLYDDIDFETWYYDISTADDAEQFWEWNMRQNEPFIPTREQCNN